MNLKLEEDSFIKIHSDHWIIENLILELNNRRYQVWIQLFPSWNILKFFLALFPKSFAITLNVIDRDSRGPSLPELIAVGILVVFCDPFAFLLAAESFLVHRRYFNYRFVESPNGFEDAKLTKSVSRVLKPILGLFFLIYIWNTPYYGLFSLPTNLCIFPFNASAVIH